MYMSFLDIHAEQRKPLDYKIQKAIESIKDGFDGCQSCSALAFSGGKDSTVLWHLIRTHFPVQAANMTVIFGNTGVEYPESLKFARELGSEWGGENFIEATPERLKKDGLKYEAQCEVLEWLIAEGRVSEVLKADGKLKTTEALEKKATSAMWDDFRRRGLVWKEGTPKSYWWCADQYGFPILGKAASKLKAHRINIDCFLRFSDTASNDDELKKYYGILRKVKISQACCDVLKKEPSHKIQRQLKVDLLFLGMMANESYRRQLTFSTKGYLFEVVTESRRINIPVYHCHPLSIWTDADIWEYIHRFNVPYSPLYDLTYTDEKGNECKMKRNGCIGCFTDYGRKNSHMYVLRQTHPGRWKTVMNYGMAQEIQKLRTCGSEQYRPSKKDYARLGILDTMAMRDGDDYNEFMEWAIENRPCAFD